MKPTELRDEIIKYCTANSDPKIVQKYSRYFKEGYNAYGLTFEKLENKVRSILSDKNINLDFVLKVCRLLVRGKKYEETSFAILLTKSFKKEFTNKTFREIEYWFKVGINNWAHTDAACSELLSYFLLNKIVSLKDFSDWRKADNRFQRRAVPVAMIKLLKTTDNYTPLFKFINPLMMDDERVVHQGLGWFLREAWKIKPKETEAFLLKWKNEAPRLIFQYATEKMSAKQKLRFKRTK
jgi:3-methyladenine DNA glycosylase AlkD